MKALVFDQFSKSLWMSTKEKEEAAPFHAENYTT